MADIPEDAALDTMLDGKTVVSLGSGGTSAEHIPAPSLDGVSFLDRYTKGQRLGVGGMGEVVEYSDRRIGRRIAVKVTLPGRPNEEEARRRFMREARLQGQLEHPAIVPVYDFGRDDDGHLYFTMKRVDGVTLKDVVRSIGEGRESMKKRFSRRKLLSAFVTVCQAIDYAHSRGVVHRDLKLSNIMLGRFGEVHVLDWGVAKLVGTAEAISSDGAAVEDGVTRVGAFVGTPGYAAPEQVTGGHVDARSDVYALGIILFEILTHEPFHQGDAMSRLMATSDGIQTSLSLRAREAEVPPELEEVCVRATLMSPDDRFASVRELYERVEAFLEGESNLQVRHDLAEDHARASETLAARALSDEGSLQDREHAMIEVGRALALQPTNELASSTMLSLLTTPPAVLPPEVVSELDHTDRGEIKQSARAATLIYTSNLLFLPLLAWQGVRSWPPVAAMFLGWAGCAIITFTAVKKPSYARSLAALALSNAAAAAGSMLYGSLVLVPALVAPNTLAYVMHLRDKHRWFAVATGTLAILVPFALERAGIVDAPYVFEGGSMTILSRATSLPEIPTLTILLLSSLVCVVFSVLGTGRVRGELLAARRQLYMQTWHLRSLFPGDSTRPPVEP